MMTPVHTFSKLQVLEWNYWVEFENRVLVIEPQLPVSVTSVCSECSVDKRMFYGRLQRSNLWLKYVHLTSKILIEFLVSTETVVLIFYCQMLLA